MKAIFSDAHGNLEALQAILDDMARQQVGAVYNLGDTTGYGPNPVECIDLAMHMDVVLLGNNDQGILSDPVWF
jgi:predicted phosphodiesterase